MELKSEHFREYMSRGMGEIPVPELKEMIAELSSNAIFFMNTDLDEIAMGRTVAVISQLLKEPEYRYLPLNLVIEAFVKGQKGELGGTSKFTPRNVSIWIAGMHEKSIRVRAEQISKEDDSRRRREISEFNSSRIFSGYYGKATCKLMAWYNNRMISIEQWNNEALEVIVRLQKEGRKIEEINKEMVYGTR